MVPIFCSSSHQLSLFPHLSFSNLLQSRPCPDTSMKQLLPRSPMTFILPNHPRQFPVLILALFFCIWYSHIQYFPPPWDTSSIGLLFFSPYFIALLFSFLWWPILHLKNNQTSKCENVFLFMYTLSLGTLNQSWLINMLPLIYLQTWP